MQCFMKRTPDHQEWHYKPVSHQKWMLGTKLRSISTVYSLN